MFGKTKMTNKSRHINEEDFRRYLEGEMNPAERNLFERKLQKHPFEAEALEGFETVSSVNIKDDLKELREKTGPKKRTKSYSYMAAAATILLIVIAGVIWIQLDDQNPVQIMVESKSLEEKDEVPEKLIKNIAPVLEEKETDKTSEIKVQENKLRESGKPKKIAITESVNIKYEQKKSSVPISEDIQKEVLEDNNFQPVRVKSSQLADKDNISNDSQDFKLQFIASEEKAETQVIQNKKYRLISGKIVSADDRIPLPGVSIIEERTQNGIISDANGNFELELINNNSTVKVNFIGMETYEFQPATDTNYLIALEPDQIALDEVVVVGFGTQRKKTITGSVSKISIMQLSDSKAEPHCGIQEFKDYLKEEAILPPDYIRRREVLKLTLYLNCNGDIIDIENKNRADSILFGKAKQIILAGPDWKPEITNGTQVDSEIKVKIVFRKKNFTD